MFFRLFPPEDRNTLPPWLTLLGLCLYALLPWVSASLELLSLILLTRSLSLRGDPNVFVLHDRGEPRLFVDTCDRGDPNELAELGRDECEPVDLLDDTLLALVSREILTLCLW